MRTNCESSFKRWILYRSSLKKDSSTSKDNTEGDFIKSLNNRDEGQGSIYLLSFLAVEILASHP